MSIRPVGPGYKWPPTPGTYDTGIKVDPEQYPTRPPVPDNPASLRRSLDDPITTVQVRHVVRHIEYYPEVQIETLIRLVENPDPHLVQRMAEAVLKEMMPAGQAVTDDDRLHAIKAVTSAFKAAVSPIKEF